MPELRSGVRKGRAPPVDQKPDRRRRSPANNRVRRGKNKNDKNIEDNNDRVRTRAAVEREAALAKQEANSNSNEENSNDIVIAQPTRNTRTARRITKPLAVRLNPSQPVVPANRPQPEVKAEVGLEAQRVRGEDKMDDESAGKSADKVVPGAEDEASTAPVPERMLRPKGSYFVKFNIGLVAGLPPLCCIIGPSRSVLLCCFTTQFWMYDS